MHIINQTFISDTFTKSLNGTSLINILMIFVRKEKTIILNNFFGYAHKCTHAA